MRVLDDDSDDQMEIDILPMIDVIFSILAFFIVSSLFLTQSEGLPVNLPEAETAAPQADASFTISLDEDGQVFLNQAPVEITALKSSIEQQINPGQEAIVIIHGDREANYGRVIEIMDEVRLIEGAKLGMATQRQD